MILAWHNEPELKESAIARLKQHRKLDEITQGVYWEDQRGCALGCLTHHNNNSHQAAERMFGLEKRIGYWVEIIFENLPKDKCAWWVVTSAEAIPVGADMSKSHHHFSIWILENEHGLLTIDDANRDAILQVIQWHQDMLDNNYPSSAARSAAAAESAESAAAAAAAAAAWELMANKTLEIFAACPVIDAVSDCPECIIEAKAALQADQLLFNS